MNDFTDKQKKAIKKLQLALSACNRVNLVVCGIDDNLHVAKYNTRFITESMRTSACEAMLDTGNYNLDAHDFIKASCYLDSGGA